MKPSLNIFWFRRDLRLADNAGLFHALQQKAPVLPIFIFDTEILDRLDDKQDRRVQFIHQALLNINDSLQKVESGIQMFHGKPVDVISQLTEKYNVEAIFTNHDYEPYAKERDQKIANILNSKEIAFHTFKDNVIFEKSEITKDDGLPYTVFTPYSRKWKASLKDGSFNSYDSFRLLANFININPLLLSLKQIGFQASDKPFPSNDIQSDLIKHYANRRDIPGIPGTSKLGVHLRFGTISIRALANISSNLSESFLNELIWRDFYQMILWHFPHIGQGKAFKPAYDQIEWRRDAGEFEKWCNGNTGYPIVDAGMRELNETGFMHNRIRMVTASFLCKHLLLDWRLGESYFAQKLLDFDFASNNGGWQWAAGSGCDAAPYFRIFNPYLQTKKFDPDFAYIKRWVPEFQEFNYPPPIVNHEFARSRCLEVYSRALKKTES